ncbi:hypothetical protein ACOMHN_003202 [Nucella lapillus]
MCVLPPNRPPGGTRPKAPRRRRPRPLQPLDVTRRDNADDRSGPLRRALQELSILQQHQRNSVAAAQEARILPQADVPALLPPGGGSLGGLYARKREELLARLLGGRPAMLSGGAVQDLRSPVVVPVSASEEGDLLLEDAHKRGGFIGAPGSPGGPNMYVQSSPRRFLSCWPVSPRAQLAFCLVL